MIDYRQHKQFEEMGELTMASSAEIIPSHVPADLVRNFDLYDFDGSREDVHPAWAHLKAEQPPIFYTPYHGGDPTLWSPSAILPRRSGRVPDRHQSARSTRACHCRAASKPASSCRACASMKWLRNNIGRF